MIDAIICCYNEDPEKINQTLRGCLEQSIPFKNIFLIDDGSKEKPIHKNQLLNDPSVRVIQLLENKGISAARNIGINISKADYVACINIEVIINSKWNEDCLKFLEKNKSIGCVFGRMSPHSKSIYTKWRMRFHELNFNKTAGIVPFAVGHAVFFRKNLLDSVRGYNESLRLVMEDSDICERIKKIGFDTYYLPQAECVSMQEDTLQSLSKKHIVRCTYGTIDAISKNKFLATTTKDLFHRMSRNIIKGRINFLPIDVLIYLYGFHFFKKRALQRIKRG